MLKVPITYPGSELQWVIHHLLLGMLVHLVRSWPHSPITYQRTFSGVVPWDNCLCFLLVICFQISNNTELISRDKESPLNSFVACVHMLETKKDVKFLWHTVTHFTTLSLIPCVDFFFSDYRDNACSLWEIWKIPPNTKKIKITWIPPQSHCLKPHFQALNQSLAGPKGTFGWGVWRKAHSRRHF